MWPTNGPNEKGPRADSLRSTTAGLQGETKIENDDEITIVCFADEPAHERVSRAARNAASLGKSGKSRIDPRVARRS